MMNDLAMLLSGAAGGGMPPQPVTGGAISDAPLTDQGAPPPAPVAAPPPATEVSGVTVTAQRPKKPVPPPINYDNSADVSAAQDSMAKANQSAGQHPTGYAQGGGDNPGIFGLLPQHIQHGTLRNVLGALGDAFLVGSGHQAQYGPRMQRQQLGNAMAGLDINDPDSVRAAATRMAVSGVPDGAEQAQKLFEQSAQIQLRKQIQEQTNQYHGAQIQARQDGAIQRMTPLVGGMIQGAKDKADYTARYARADAMAKRISPDASAADFGLPDPEEWTPGMTATTGATTGQVMHQDTSNQSIQERRDAAAQASQDRRRGQDMTSASSHYSTNHRTSQARLPTAGSIDAQIMAKLNAGQPLGLGEQQYWDHKMKGSKTRQIPAGLQVQGGGQPKPAATGPVVTNGDVAYVKAHPEMKQQFEAHFGPGSYKKYVGG